MPHPEQVHMKVEELIDTSTRAWRTNLLSELFSPEEGRFSIKSGYWVAQQWLQSTDSNASSSSNASAYAKLWKHIWKANIPPKVKNFTWRVCHNILPTKVNLTKKGVRVESECGICQGEEEIAEHVLFTCSFSRAVWMLEMLERWCCGEANTKTTRTGGLPSPWSAPLSQWWVKLNTDGALRDRDKLGGVGVVFRDWRGWHLTTRVQQYPGIVSVLILKMYAIRFGL
ncbi:hypothetical protein ACFX2I_018797 [Malus domestica]